MAGDKKMEWLDCGMVGGFGWEGKILGRFRRNHFKYLLNWHSGIVRLISQYTADIG